MRCFKNIFVLLLCISSEFSSAQMQDRNWCFGDSVRIDWNNIISPIVLTSKTINQEPNASISETDGELYCYFSSDDVFTGNYGRIYNSTNQLMENADSLFSYSSAANGALFIPFPGNSYKMYFFHSSINNSIVSLNYSVIDKNANAGLGKVISKNNFLIDSITEHLTAVKHGNGRDWWIITKKINSNKFIKYLVTPLGIQGPFEEQIGSVSYIKEGESSASLKGNKLVFVSMWGNMDIIDFDRCSGEMSNCIQLGVPPYNQAPLNGWQYYGCEFSPDMNRVYFTRSKFSPILTTNVYQYSLNTSNPITTRTDILAPTQNEFHLMGLKLAPNNKIYTCRGPGGGILDSSYKYLSVINSPNDSGTACNFQLFSFYLNGKNGSIGLPNMPNYNLGALHGSGCDSLCTQTLSGSENVSICEGDSIYLMHTFQTQAGTYLDTLITMNGCDSAVTTILSFHSVNDSVTHNGDTLTAVLTSATYQWHNCDNGNDISGATNQSFIATADGNYALVITDGFGCSRLSSCFFVDANGIDEIGNYLFRVHPNPATNELTIEILNGIAPKQIEITNSLGVTVIQLHQTKPTAQVNIRQLSTGVYFVKVKMQDGSVTVRRFVKL